MPLAEVVFDSDLENLANYYYLVAQLQAAQPWSGNMLEVLPIAEKSVAMAEDKTWGSVVSRVVKELYPGLKT